MTSILVAMSGGVDSSVAAALLQRQGYDVAGVTMKLWGGDSDTGCCSVADVDDARRVADQLDIPHHVFNFGADFERLVVDAYVDEHARGRTPNPCIDCNRHLKFDRLLRRAEVLGFDLVATGHHARVVDIAGGGRRVGRGADAAKDQSYVLHMVTPDQLERVRFPVGHLTKAEVRELADELGLRTARKPDSQDVCFISRSPGGRRRFLEGRLPLDAGRVVDASGRHVGHVDAVQLVTIGQRKGLGVSGSPSPVYAVDVDVATRTVTVGGRHELAVERSPVTGIWWAAGAVATPLLVQTSAHGAVAPGVVAAGEVRWLAPHRRLAPGQSLVFYDGDIVAGSAVAGAPR